MEVRIKEFQFISLRKAQELLDCSREQIYIYVREGILIPYYIKRNKEGRGKSYFKIDEIEKALVRKQADEIL